MNSGSISGQIDVGKIVFLHPNTAFVSGSPPPIVTRILDSTSGQRRNAGQWLNGFGRILDSFQSGQRCSG
jgi:hypothetical protein